MHSAKYCPRTFEITGCETAYALNHEFAHLQQHVDRTPFWRAREAFFARPWTRFLGMGSLVNLAVEIEAALIARKEMKACGIWGFSDAAEAIDGLRAYALEMAKKWA